MKKNKTILLRAETKQYEHRTPLIPEHAAELISSQNKVIVEHSEDRVFSDDEYRNAGCEIVDAGSWQETSTDTYILGIKELPATKKLLVHKHIYFAHIFKGQVGAKQTLNQFQKGKGLLYDLEYLKNDKGNGITAFSYWAGVAGCAISLLIWLQKHKENKSNFQIPEFYRSEAEVVELLNNQLNVLNSPSSLIIGAKGHCAAGVIAFLSKIGLNATLLYKNNTLGRKEFPEIFQHNIFFNCVYLKEPLSPFITKEQLPSNKNLSIIADISCDPNGPNNPLPIYNNITSFKKPALRVCDEPISLDLIAIDHLPSFFPKESSTDFSAQFLPFLKQLLKNGTKSPAWVRAEEFFNKAVDKEF